MTFRADDRLERWLRERGTVKRESAILANLTVSGNTTTSVSASRSADFYVTVKVSSWTGTGTVTINGLDANSDPIAASLVFVGNYQLTDTEKAFRSISSVVTSGFTGSGAVRVWASDRVGQPKETLSTIKTIKCAVTRARQGEIVESPGGAPLDSAQIFMYPNNGVKRNDRIVVDDITWEVKAIRHIRNFRRERAIDVAVVFAEDQT